MAESTVESDSVPRLPLDVLEKVASMLPENTLKDRLQLAAVSSKPRLAVLSSIQQMKRRHMEIYIDQGGIIVAGILVKTPSLDDCEDYVTSRSSYFSIRRLLSATQQIIRRMVQTRVNRDSNRELRSASAYTQMACLLAFGQPNSLYLSDYEGKLSEHLPLIRSIPLSLNSLFLHLTVDEIGVDSPLDHILKAVASKTNLETLRIGIRCLDQSAATRAKLFVPQNSPLNHLLTLENLRALRIDVT